MKKFCLFLLILCFTCGCGSTSIQNDKKINPITADSVFSMIDRENVYIIDVREEYEYRSGHIENAYNIPLTKIDKVQKSFLPLDGVVIVYCQSGNRSRKAAEILLDLGYQNVYDMGGVNSWNYELIVE